MPFINADRIKETTTTTGTGAITLAGAVVGFRAFSSVMAIGDTCTYSVVSDTLTESEAGIGTYSALNTLTRTTVQSSSNANAAVVFTAGVKNVFIGPIAGTQIPYDPVTGALNLSVNALNDVAITSPTVNQVLKYSGTEWTNQADAVNVGTVTSVSGAGTVSGLTLTGTVTSSGSLTLGGAISTLNQNTTGNAATVTTNANLTGHVTSVGNATSLGSFTSAQLAGALSDETGTGAAVFATSPTLVTPLSNSLSAIPVASGAGNSLILSAGTGVGVGAGGNVETKPGTQGSSGGDGRNYWRTSGSINTRPSGGWTANTSNVVAYSFVSNQGHNTFNIGPDESNWSSGIATHYYNETMLSVRHPSESSSFNYIAAFYTSNANKTSILLGTSLTEAHVRAGFGAGSTPIDLVLSSVHSISPWYIENLRLKATGETKVTGFLTTNAIAAIPVTSGAGNSLTIAAGSGVTSGAGANLILNPGEQATTGGRGTVLIDGLNAGKSKSSGTNNTVFGAGALAAITTGSANTAIGSLALGANTVASHCIAIGYQALQLNISGENNVAAGYQSLRVNNSGNSNTAIGYATLISSNSSNNVAIGTFSLYSTTGGNNTAVGWATDTGTGSNNLLVGYSAGMGAGNFNASNSIVIGANAVGNGSNTTTIGNSSTTATYLHGTIAAVPVTSGAGNSLTIAAGSGVTSGAGANLILNPGEQATTGGRGTVLIDGLTVGKGKGNFTTNTAFGLTALTANTTGDYNTAIGSRSLILNTGGYRNSAVGEGTLNMNTNGHRNVAIGYAALDGNTTGAYNTAIGANALASVVTGNYNVGIGTFSLLNTTGSENVGIGYNVANTGVGNLTTGTNNILIGNSAGMGSGNSAATNSIVIGYNGLGNGSNTTTIGNSSTTATYLYGKVIALGGVATPVLTVATLTAAATAGAGARAFVSDSTATTFAAIVAGGGANGVPVYSDGTNWRIG